MKYIKLFVLFPIFFCFFSSVDAQSTQIAWGEQVELEKKNTLNRLVGMDDENYYLICGRAKKSEFELLTFGISDHKLKNKQPLNFEYDKTKYTFLNSIHTAAGIFLYYFQNNKKENKIELYVAKIEQGKLGEFQLVHEQEKEKGLFSNHVFSSQASVLGNGYKINIRQKISPDKKLALLSYRLEIKGRFEEFQILCLNQNMKVEWEQKIDFAEEKRKIIIGDFQIDDDGMVYSLSRVHKYTLKGKILKRIIPEDYFYRIYKISEQDVDPIDVFSNEKVDYYLPKAMLVLPDVPKEESLPILMGTYASKKKGSEILGCFFAEVSTMGVLQEMKLHPFKNISLVSRNFRDNLDKMDAPKPSYNFIDSYQFENGNRALIAENYVVESIRRLNSNNSYDTETTYYTDELLLFLFDNSGNLLTDTIVKKQLWTENRMLASYAGIEGNTKIYLLYNHKMKKKERKAKGVKGTPTTMTVFNDQGEVITETLFSNGNKAGIPYFYPKYIAKNNTQFLLGKFMRGKFTFGTIPFE